MYTLNKERLKIGVLVDSYDIPNWQLEIIKAIKNSSFAEITLVIKNNAPSINNSSKFSKLLFKRDKIIIRLHLRLDQFIFGKDTDYSKIVDSKILLEGINEITVTPIEDRYRDSFCEDDIREIKKINLDIILQFGFGALTGEILNTSKYGVWLSDSDNYNINKCKPLGYWEVINKWKTTSSILKILNEDLDKSKVIYRFWMLTNYISISKNRNACYWRTATVIPFIIEKLCDYGSSYLLGLEKKFNHNIPIGGRKFYKIPSSLTALKNIFRHFWTIFKRVCQKIFFSDHWYVLYKINSNETSISSLKEFKPLNTSKDRFWADPFVITRDNKYYIFFPIIYTIIPQLKERLIDLN